MGVGGVRVVVQAVGAPGIFLSGLIPEAFAFPKSAFEGRLIYLSELSLLELPYLAGRLGQSSFQHLSTLCIPKLR